MTGPKDTDPTPRTPIGEPDFAEICVLDQRYGAKRPSQIRVAATDAAIPTVATQTTPLERQNLILINKAIGQADFITGASGAVSSPMEKRHTELRSALALCCKVALVSVA